MKNRRKLTTLYFLSGMLAFGGVVASVATEQISAARGNIQEYNLSLNSSNKVTSDGEHTLLTGEGNPVKFTYSDVNSSTTGHVTLKDGGKFVNKSAITSITSFKIIFDGNLQAKTSYDAKTWGSYWNLESNFEYELGSNPYYIEFFANSGSVTVSSLVYTYSCVANPDVVDGSGEYLKITNANQLVVGSKVIIAASGYNVAMSNKQNDNNRGQAAITKGTDNLTSISSDVAEFTLLSGKNEGTYAFKDTNGYLCAASSSKNYLKSEETLSVNSSFKITGTTAELSIVSQGSYTRDTIQYNSDAALFSCYTSGQKSVSIYQSQGCEAPVDEIGFIATDENANNYHNYDKYATANALVVKSIDSNGTLTVLENGYSVVVKDSDNNVININEPFGKGGLYTATITYKNYIPQIINLTVSGGVFDPIVDINVDSISGPLDTSDTFMDYLTEHTDWGCVADFDSGSSSHYAYNDFATNELTLTLLNPSGISYSLNTPFGIEGTWKVRISYNINPSIYKETSFNISIVPVLTISLNNETATIELGNTLQLSVTNVTPTDATHKEVSWSSTDSTIASVSDSGLVTGIKVGSATIKATAVDGSNVFGSCLVTVTKPSSTEYTFTSKEWHANPDNWSGSKNGNGYSNSGVQITKALSGTYATSPKQFSNVTKVTVGYCTNASSGAGSIAIKVGSTTIADTSVTTSGGTTKRDMVFTPSTPLDGYVTITVTCTTSSIYICSCKIEVGSDPIYPTAIDLTSDKTSIGVGDTTTINVGYTPENVNVKNLIWTSNNTSVATVTNAGVVTGISAGSATITCSADAYNSTKVTDTISITVNNVAPTSVSLNKETLELGLGGSEVLTATVLPANATNKSVTFSSSDTSVATVTNAGLVTGVAAGSATITVNTVDGNKTDTCTVNVSSGVLAKTHIEETYNDYFENSLFDEDHIPTIGNPKLLVVPVWFTDLEVILI